MRRLLLAALAATMTLTAAPAGAGNKWQAITVTPATMDGRHAYEFRAAGMQVSGDNAYGHNPGLGAYETKGAWSSGTVLEARGYYVERADGKVYLVTKWRTRRGTTAIASDWNTGGANSVTYSEILSYTTGYTYGHKEDYPDYIGTSAITLVTVPDCSQVAGTDRYQGLTYGVTANPAGADAVSGLKTEGGAFEDNNILDCGEQF